MEITMKKHLKKTSIALLILLVISILFTACKPDTGSGDGADVGDNGSANNGGSGVTPDAPDAEDVPDGTPGLIFNSKSELTLILADDAFPTDASGKILNALKEGLGSRFSVRFDDKGAAAEHEIVLGRAENRVVSHMAYSRLDEVMGADVEEFGGYVLYSDGSSLALACTDELGTQHIDGIVDELVSWAEETSLVKTRGVVSANKVNMHEIYAAEDEARRDAAFEAIEKQLGSEFAQSLRELYRKAYSGDMVEWLANLYEPRVCVCDNYVNGIRVCLHPTDENGKDLCANGGFYYSNSARNTVGFLPDVESTYQALLFMEMTGMLDEFGGNFGGFIDGQIRADIVAFTKGLQNPDGYFYHPQWSIEDSRAHWSRVTRDLMWAETILGRFGETPYYDTPDGSMSGVGSRPTPSAKLLTARLSESSVALVSKVVSAASTNLPDHLRSPEALKEYLSQWQMDVFASGYTAANDLASQAGLLVEADRQLGGTLKPVLFEFLEEKKNPENGLWRPEVDYDGINALFKALMVYSAFDVYFTYADKAAESVFSLLASDEIPGHVCGVYNAWYNVAGLINNIRSCYPSAERDEIADSILARARELAPEALRHTITKTLLFRREDSSFSYFADHTSETSQGMPVCTGVLEGDINASIICSGGLLDHISQALALELPSVFGTYELAVFMDIIENNGSSVKDSLPPDVAADFESDTLNTETEQLEVSVGSGGTALVETDPQNDRNKVLHFTSLNTSGSWDAVNIPNNSYKFDTNCLVFEGDFMFSEEGNDEGLLVQFYLGYMGKKSAYLMTFNVTSTHVELWEESTDAYFDSFRRLVGRFELGEWFKLRVEYYCGEDNEELGITAHETTRIKVYTNDELVMVSANYYDQDGVKFAEGVGTPYDEIDTALFFIMSYLEADIYLDDLYLGYKKIDYKSERDTEGLIVNEDAENERLEYTFDDNELPEDIAMTGSKIKLENEALAFTAGSGTSKLTIPVNQISPLANVYSIGFDVTFDAEGADEGDLFTISFKDPHRGNTVAAYTLTCEKIDGELAFVPRDRDTTILPSVAIFDDGNTHHLEFAFFVESGTTLIYKDGQFLASTGYGVVAKHYLYDVTDAVIEYRGSANFVIDNLYCEKRIGSFAEEVEPKVEREQLDFAQGSLSDMKNLSTSGKIENGMLDVAGGYATITANERSPYVSAYQFYMDINTTYHNSESPTYVRFLDGRGNTVIGIAMVERDGMMYFYEMVNDARYGEYVGAIAYNGEASLLFNYFALEQVIAVYVNGTAVLVSGQMNGANEKIAAVKVSSATACIDNLYLDGITLTYTLPVIDALTRDDTEEVITYDHTSLGNYPDRVNIDESVTQTSSVEYVERDGTLTKVLAYKKLKEGGAHGARFSFADASGHSSLVFESDMRLDGGYLDATWRSVFQLYFANQSGGTHMYIPQFKVVNDGTGNHLVLNVLNGAGNELDYDCGALTEDGWFHLRIEIRNGDGTQDPVKGTRMTVYVNEVEIYSGSEFFGIGNGQEKPSIDEVYQLLVIPLDGITGTIYFDNTVLK